MEPRDKVLWAADDWVAPHSTFMAYIQPCMCRAVQRYMYVCVCAEMSLFMLVYLTNACENPARCADRSVVRLEPPTTCSRISSPLCLRLTCLWRLSAEIVVSLPTRWPFQVNLLLVSFCAVCVYVCVPECTWNFKGLKRERASAALLATRAEVYSHTEQLIYCERSPHFLLDNIPIQQTTWPHSASSALFNPNVPSCFATHRNTDSQ